MGHAASSESCLIGIGDCCAQVVLSERKVCGFVEKDFKVIRHDESKHDVRSYFLGDLSIGCDEYHFRLKPRNMRSALTVGVKRRTDFRLICLRQTRSKR